MKTFLLITTLLLFINCSSQSVMNKTEDAKIVFADKTQFIGKPLKFLLSKMHVPIQAVNPIPNKNHNEINNVTFFFISLEEYRKTLSKDIDERPIRIKISFNQNQEQIGNKCLFFVSPSCFQWTKQDEENLGDLIVNDVYVIGK